jgi:chromosome segregation ATPase
MKYVDRIKANGTDAQKNKQFEQAAAKAALQWESTLLETRSKLAQAQADLEDAKSTLSLSPQSISDLMDTIEGYEKGLSRLEQLKTELF